MLGPEKFIPPADSQKDWFSVELVNPDIGKGVILQRPVRTGTPLNLFPRGFGSWIVLASDASDFHKSHGVGRWSNDDGLYFVIPRFDNPDIIDEPGWFLNHQQDTPTVYWDPLVADGLCVAAQDLIPGNELTIDYPYLREPEVHARRPESSWYYREIGAALQYDPSIILEYDE